MRGVCVYKVLVSTISFKCEHFFSHPTLTCQVYVQLLPLVSKALSLRIKYISITFLFDFNYNNLKHLIFLAINFQKCAINDYRLPDLISLL